MAPAPRARTGTVRCAIYTRKSTDEGLEQEFNSLDAQREAAEAFIQSQRGEGWEVLPEHYDDGGFSGANMDRPALRRLLADIRDGRVDAVVVYKVDRLSRSLLDFSRIMDVLDQQGVAFVSVTQQFNTATSMGRLVLHILLSFAQFEREMIAERTRDKMSAARRKGKWVGGMPVLGYDVDPNGGRLLVNPEEATRVREMFDIYLREESLLATAKDMNRRGWRTKSWTTRKGRLREGREFTKQNVLGLLTNVIYTGQVSHRGTLYPGEHDAIVDTSTWSRVQDLLRQNGRHGGRDVRNKHGALLKGLVRCTACDAAMVHTYTTKGSKRYRYYVCLRAQKQGWESCPTKSISAPELERFVVERVRAVGKDRGAVAATLAAARSQQAEAVARIKTERADFECELRRLQAQTRREMDAPDEPGAAARLAEIQERVGATEIRLIGIRERLAAAQNDRVDERDLAAAMAHFDPIWNALFPREQARIMRLLLQRVGFDGERGTLAVTFRPSGIKALAQEVLA